MESRKHMHARLIINIRTSRNLLLVWLRLQDCSKLRQHGSRARQAYSNAMMEAVAAAIVGPEVSERIQTQQRGPQRTELKQAHGDDEVAALDLCA